MNRHIHIYLMKIPDLMSLGSRKHVPHHTLMTSGNARLWLGPLNGPLGQQLAMAGIVKIVVDQSWQGRMVQGYPRPYFIHRSSMRALLTK